jgi:hypothetical protein
LEARLERSDSPDERLLTAKTRLERRLELEREQLEKLTNLLERSTGQPEESGEYFGSEEIEDIHRSFEEVRQNLATMQARMESSEMPRDLSNRLASFEERIVRREEVDSELFSQVLALQTALDQERQTVRRLSRRIREQDQSLDALREAVEDSVVATVDLAERLDEIEESINDPERKGQGASGASADEPPSGPLPLSWSAEIETLRELVDDARGGLLDLRRQVVDSLAAAAAEREELRHAQADLAASTASPQAAATPEPSEPPALPSPIPNDVLAALVARLEALETAAPAARSSEPAPEPPRLEETAVASGPKPAVFAKNGHRRKQVALFGVRPNQRD